MASSISGCTLRPRTAASRKFMPPGSNSPREPDRRFSPQIDRIYRPKLNSLAKTIEPKPLAHDSYHESDVGHVADNRRSIGSGACSGGEYEKAFCYCRVFAGEHRGAGSVHLRIWRTYHPDRSGPWHGFDTW